MQLEFNFEKPKKQIFIKIDQQLEIGNYQLVDANHVILYDNLSSNQLMYGMSFSIDEDVYSFKIIKS